MNRYTITNSVSGKIYEVESETFPPNRVFIPEWGDPGPDKVLIIDATPQQIADSIGRYTDQYAIVEFVRVTKEYYVLSHTLSVTEINIDTEVADKAAANQEARDRRLRLKGYANIETIGMAALRLVIKDILTELRGD